MTNAAKMSATAATRTSVTPVITAAPTTLALAAAGLEIDVGSKLLCLGSRPLGYVFLFILYIYIFYYAEYLKVEYTYGWRRQRWQGGRWMGGARESRCIVIIFFLLLFLSWLLLLNNDSQVELR